MVFLGCKVRKEKKGILDHPVKKADVLLMFCQSNGLSLLGQICWFLLTVKCSKSCNIAAWREGDTAMCCTSTFPFGLVVNNGNTITGAH